MYRITTAFISELQSSGVQAGPIVGGVLGALISLILILAIVVTVVLTIRCLNRQGKKDIQGNASLMTTDNMYLYACIGIPEGK